MLANKLQKVKTPHDLRVLKIRLQYEAMRAEDDLNQSLQASGQLFTLVSVFQKSAHIIRHASSVFTRISSFFGRIFNKKQKQEEYPCEED